MCPKQVHEGSYDDLYVPISVVMIDLRNLRCQMFSRAGFALSDVSACHWLCRDGLRSYIVFPVITAERSADVQCFGHLLVCENTTNVELN